MTHDPGGKVRIALADGVESSAIFGGDNHEYRYRLVRVWSGDANPALFVGMNPSTADADADDPTVAKCCRFARKWGYGSLIMANVYAWRATDQAALARVADPIGPENDKWISVAAREAGVIVMAYGTPKVPALRQRGPAVARMLAAAGHPLHVLRLSKDGRPVHPLYLPESLTPTPWNPMESANNGQ